MVNKNTDICDECKKERNLYLMKKLEKKYVLQFKII